MQRICDFLKEAKTYYLATSENGQPRVRPFGTIEIFDGKLCIQTGRVKPCYRQMKDDPRVEICAMVGGEWIRVCAEAVENTDIAAEEHMLAAYPNLSAMYKPGDGNCVIFYLVNGTATFSSFTKAPEVVEF